METGITNNLDVIKWNIVCEDEGHESFTYVLAGDGYGLLLGRTLENEIAIFNTWNDHVFDEVKGIAISIEPKAEKSGFYIQHILGFACDLSPRELQFDFTGKIHCPKCGTVNVSYTQDEKPEILQMDIPIVTHEEWNNLDLIEKKKKIQGALNGLIEV